MRYAVISDLHANLTALRAVLTDAQAQGAKRIICLGDVVGYGPLPKETLALTRYSAAVTLAGNHDDAVSGRQSAADFINLAGDAVARHRDALDSADLAWLRSLPYSCELDGATAAHGDLTDPAKFYYVENEDDAAANFAASDAQLMFVGHTHVPTIFLTGQSGKVYRLAPQDFSVEDGKRYIVNPGSVGYPRESNGECFSSYLIYDSATRSVFFRRLPFSVASVMQRGRNPRRRKAALVLAAIATLTAAALGVFIALRPVKTETQTITKTESVVIADAENPALILTTKNLTLKSAAHYVRANLKLAKGSDPVSIHLVFKDALGNPCGDPFVKTVKSTSRDRFKIPSGALSALFTLTKPTPASQPHLTSFTPSCD